MPGLYLIEVSFKSELGVVVESIPSLLIDQPSSIDWSILGEVGCCFWNLLSRDDEEGKEEEEEEELS